MTHPASPRRLLLIAAPAADGRQAGAPIRRYRLGRVLMGPEELIGQQAAVAAGGGAGREGRGEGRRLA